jgi:hypothetical protein
MKCFLICPDFAITVELEEENAPQSTDSTRSAAACTR